ncbi:carbohydrate-binding domain-containing protein [Maribellus sp. YY47]|uniref:carbohydrate-binding domain-containing protein n=1 Tax=Maribellus sp. YY47 TaxID=2929486 RepID=UPI002000F8EB|nr:carbohydrate-binding domain-containing protein [Maribellus sp. YY47]MCK3685866.1 carbohydrate-binding domain-containing protein [Maribellus sp. YY47]
MRKVQFFVLAFGSVMWAACNGLSTDFDEEDDNTTTEKVDNEESIDDAMANNSGDHDAASDYVWNASDVVAITMDGTSVTENSDNVSVTSGKIIISAAGDYSFTGTLNDGQIWVETEEDGIVRLILNGANITSSSSAPVYVKSAEKVLIALNAGTSNVLTDGSSYKYDNADAEEPNAAVFSKSDLTIFGPGSLQVNANFNDGITSKDGLIIASGNINVNAADDGIRGKDYLIIKDGKFNITAGGDGLKSDNDSDDEKGYIGITAGTFNISARGDAVSAETDLMLTYAEMELLTTGSVSAYSSTSSKGLKAGVNIIIDNGVYSITSTDDAIHSDQTITINAGTFEISTGDDGIHAGFDLEIKDGNINITKSYEGIESAAGDVILNGGTIHLKSNDDGLNVAGGGDSMMGGGRPGGGWGGPSPSSGNYYLYINGGYLYLNASGDGLDSNGSVVMTGGTVLIDGPTNNGNGALDYDGSFQITGGTIIAAGSSGMAQAPASSSSQYFVLVKFNTSLSAGTLFHVQNSDGIEIITYKPSKTYQSVAFSSPTLKKGSGYGIYTGGSSTGQATDGLYSGGTYSGGTLYTSFTISSILMNM